MIQSKEGMHCAEGYEHANHVSPPSCVAYFTPASTEAHSEIPLGGHQSSTTLGL